MWKIGLAADRPAPGVSGRVYFASDTGQVSLDRTTSWLDIGVVGPTGPAGPTGLDGKTIRSGSGAPASGLGVDGDFYIDTTAESIYGPKTSGAWGSATSLVGPQGIQGIQGIQGPAGSGAAPNIKLNGTQVVAGASNFDFSSAFTLTESPTGEGNIGANFGSMAGTFAQGNDARFSDQRVPTDDSVANAKVTAGAAIAESKLALASDAAAGTASRRTLGTGAQQAAPGNDSRLGLPSQIAVVGARVSWTNVPSAITEYFGVSAYRTKCDLGTITEMRTTVTVDGGTTVPSGTVLRVQYSTDASTWNDTHGTLSVVNMAVDTAGTKDTGWFTPVAGLKASNIYLRAIVQSGNGSTTLVSGNVHVYVR